MLEEVTGLAPHTLFPHPDPNQVRVHYSSMLEEVTGLAPLGPAVSHCSAGVDDVHFYWEALP